MHWTNALAMIVLITSGWAIYDDEVLFGWLYFSSHITLGSWMAEALLWHFAAMWVLAINGLAYIGYGLVSGRFYERFFPITPRAVLHDVTQALRGHLAHEDLTVYNAVQKLLYIVVILAGILQVVTGIAIWKPIQFSEITAWFGGFQNARIAHFLGMSVIAGFLLVHVALSLLVPRTLLAMLTGGPTLPARRSRP
jgi:thiosulfate reductase cytochrome b subunit